MGKTSQKVAFFEDSGCCPEILNYTLAILLVMLLLSSLVNWGSPSVAKNFIKSTWVPLSYHYFLWKQDDLLKNKCICQI